MRKIIISIFIAVFGLILLLGTVNAYFGWYERKPWIYRQNTKSASFVMNDDGEKYFFLGKSPTESFNRGVLVEELAYSVVPDSLLAYFNPKDTLFYIEKGFTYGKRSAKKTRILTSDDTDFPYQLIALPTDYNERLFLPYYDKNDNKGVNDSIGGYIHSQVVYLNEIKYDTLYLKLLLGSRGNDTGKEREIGMLKLFSKK